MNQRIGFVGWIDNKFKVFYTGDIFYTKINGMSLVIDWDKIETNRKRLV